MSIPEPLHSVLGIICAIYLIAGAVLSVVLTSDDDIKANPIRLLVVIFWCGPLAWLMVLISALVGMAGAATSWTDEFVSERSGRFYEWILNYIQQIQEPTRTMPSDYVDLRTYKFRPDWGM